MKKVYKISLGVLAVLIVVVALSINSIVKNLLISTLEEKTGKDITIKTLWLNPFTGNISSKGIGVSEDGRSLFTLKSFKLDSDPLKLTKGTLYIGEITLIEPTVDISKKTDEGVESKDDSKPQTQPSPEPAVAEKPKEEVPGKKESFIKEVIVKNITIKNLVLEGEDSQFKSLNTLTLEVPDFIYKDDTLNLSATLDIIDSGKLNLLLTTDTGSGEFQGTVSSDKLLLNTALTQNKEVFNIGGVFNGILNFSGNYQEKRFKTSGNMGAKDTLVSSSDNTELLSAESIDINLTEVSYPDISAVSTGTFKLSITSEFLPLILKDNPDVKAILGGGDISGSYNLEYPNITTAPKVILEEIGVHSTEKIPYEGTLKGAEGTYNISSNFLDKTSVIEGITSLNTLDFTDEDQNSLFFRSGQVDLKAVLAEEDRDILIKRIQFSEGSIEAKGNKLDKVYLDMSNITDKKLDSTLIFSASGDDFSKISGDMKVLTSNIKEPSDLSLSGDLNITSLRLEGLKKFVDDLPYEMSGSISYDSYISYSKDNITSVGKINGNSIKIRDDKGLDLSIGSLDSTLDLGLINSEMTLNNTNLSFNKVSGRVDKDTEVNLPTGNISIKRYTPSEIRLNLIGLTNPDITIYTAAEKKAAPKGDETSKPSAVSPPKDSPKEAAAPPKKKDPLPKLSIKKMDIKNGTFTEVKGSKKTTFKNIKLYSQNFTSERKKPFTVDTSLSLEGIQSVYLKGTASLNKDWDFDPKTINFNGSLGVTNITLKTFNDQMSKSLPNKVEAGTLSSRGNLKLNKGKISSESKIKISDLKLGASTGVTSKVPLNKVTDALKDKQGDINITVPIEGDLNDPEFGVTNIILASLIASFGDVIKTPEKAISNILTLGTSEKEGVVYFDYLDSEPKSSDLEKLKKTVELLKGNPASKVKVTIFTNDKVEKGLMKTKDLTNILFGGKKESSSDKLDDLMDKRKAYILNYLSSDIDSSRIEVIISDRDKNLPQAKVEIIQ